MTPKIKEAAANKISAHYAQAKRCAEDAGIYWKVEEDRRLELNKLDRFEVEVLSYILMLIEKDNKL